MVPAARDAHRAAGVRRGELVEQIDKFCAHDRIVNQNLGRCIGRELGAQFTARFRVGKHQCHDIVAVGPGEYHVSHIGREVIDEARAQWSDAGPSAGGQLEVLGDATIEQQSLARIVGVDESDGAAGDISWKSPVGRALLGKAKGETVTARWHAGLRELTIGKIVYR